MAQKNTIGVSRGRVARPSGCHELISITNFGQRRVPLEVRLRYRATFQDIFVLKGFAQRSRSLALEPLLRHDSVTLQRLGEEWTASQQREAVDEQRSQHEAVRDQAYDASIVQYVFSRAG